MLGYLSKFVLQMLPTISATVIGAYIVATWVNPKAPTDPAKVAAGSQGAKASYPAGQPAKETAREVEATAPADSGPSPVKTAANPETIRIIPIVKQPQPSFDAPASPPGPVASAAPESVAPASDRKDANELARAAIQRQRAGTETPRAADEPAKQPVAAARAQPQARAVPEAMVAPPLPPAVTITAPRYPQDAGADQAGTDRLTPPAEIPPVGNPLSLHASHRVAAQSPSPAGDFLNATRSFFRALTPQ